MMTTHRPTKGILPAANGRTSLVPSDEAEVLTPEVIVVDDDEGARKSMCALVTAMGARVQSFESAADFLSAYDGSHMSCLVTDLRMPGISGLELQQRLVRADCRIPVIIVSAYIDVCGTVLAMKDGAVAVLTKPYEEQRLSDALEQCFNLAKIWRDEDRHDADILGRFATLTEGERAVFDHVVDGLPNKAIASRLGVSIRTVEDRRAKIMKRLSVYSFASLLHFAHEAHSIKERKFRRQPSA